MGPGKTVPTTVKYVSVTVSATASLVFKANGVDNSGTFTLSDGTAETAGGELIATVDNSRFEALSITQTGSRTADVELGNDYVPGQVTVSEGDGSGDSIVLDNDRFGSILLEQG